MNRYLPIRDIYVRKILDAGGETAIEAEVLAGENIVGRSEIACDPAVGEYWIEELVSGVLADKITGTNVFARREIDEKLVRAAGKKAGREQGEKAVLMGISVASARAAAKALGIPLYQYLGGIQASILPIPMITVLSGGIREENILGVRSFLIVPAREQELQKSLTMCAQISSKVKDILKMRGLCGAIGRDGGYVPELKDIKEALFLLKEATENAGYRAGEDILFALDMAVSDFCHKKMEYYTELAELFPLFDALKPLPDVIRLQVDQAETLSELTEAAAKAHRAGYQVLLSRSAAETKDTMLADLSVALQAEQIQAGALCRGENIAKYNRLLWIEKRK